MATQKVIEQLRDAFWLLTQRPDCRQQAELEATQALADADRWLAEAEAARATVQKLRNITISASERALFDTAERLKYIECIN